MSAPKYIEDLEIMRFVSYDQVTVDPTLCLCMCLGVGLLAWGVGWLSKVVGGG